MSHQTNLTASSCNVGNLGAAGGASYCDGGIVVVQFGAVHRQLVIDLKLSVWFRQILLI